MRTSGPLSQKLDGVLRGDSLMAEYVSGLETAANIDYTSGDGRLLVNIFEERSLIMELWMGWVFHKVRNHKKDFKKVFALDDY